MFIIITADTAIITFCIEPVQHLCNGEWRNNINNKIFFSQRLWGDKLIFSVEFKEPLDTGIERVNETKIYSH